MSLVLVAAALSLVSPPADLPSLNAQKTFSARALDDSALGAIRGARGVAFSGGRGALPRLAQDVTLRELSVSSSLTRQQFDNWFVDVGAQLIFDNLTR